MRVEIAWSADFFPHQLVSFNLVPGHPHFDEKVLEFFNMSEETAAGVVEDLLPLAMMSLPSLELAASGVAMAPNGQVASAATVLCAKASIQISCAKMLVAWHSRENRKSQFMAWSVAQAIGSHSDCLTKAKDVQTLLGQILPVLTLHSTQGSGVDKQTASVFLPHLTLFDSTIQRGETILRFVWEVATPKVTKYLGERLAKLVGLYPQDGKEFSCDPAARNLHRVKRDIFKNKSHSMIKAESDRLLQTQVEVQAVCQHLPDAKAALFAARTAAQDSSMYVAAAGVLNLTVNKKTSGTYTASQLKDMAVSTISALVEMELWGELPANCGRERSFRLPPPLQEELAKIRDAEASV